MKDVLALQDLRVCFGKVQYAMNYVYYPFKGNNQDMGTPLNILEINRLVNRTKKNPFTTFKPRTFSVSTLLVTIKRPIHEKDIQMFST